MRMVHALLVNKLADLDSRLPCKHVARYDERTSLIGSGHVPTFLSDSEGKIAADAFVEAHR